MVTLNTSGPIKSIYGIIEQSVLVMLNGVGILKKILYTSILLGAFALSGCTNDEADIKDATAESSPTEQSIAINNEVNTTKTEEAASILLNLTQEQKENYYNQYLKILEEISVEYPSADMEIKPLDEYLDEHWIEPEELRKRVIYFLENGVSYPI